MRKVSSPNRMIWQYAECLRRMAHQVRQQKNGNRQKQDIALCIFLSVTVVESFINVFFRMQIEKPEHRQHATAVLRGLDRRISLDRKVKTWPKLLYGRTWDLARSTGRRFSDLKEKRNALMHFTSSHESVTEIPGVVIQGMADTTAYDTLGPQDADEAVCVAEGSVCAILELAGYSPDAVAKGLHYWTGKVPASFLAQSDPVR